MNVSIRGVEGFEFAGVVLFDAGGWGELRLEAHMEAISTGVALPDSPQPKRVPDLAFPEPMSAGIPPKRPSFIHLATIFSVLSRVLEPCHLIRV